MRIDEQRSHQERGGMSAVDRGGEEWILLHQYRCISKRDGVGQRELLPGTVESDSLFFVGVGVGVGVGERNREEKNEKVREERIYVEIEKKMDQMNRDN